MKKIPYMLILLSGMACACQAVRLPMNFSVRVTDESGAVVTGATVTASYDSRIGVSSPPKFVSYKVQTDSNGIGQIQGGNNGELTWGVRKSGYYHVHNMELRFTNVISGRLQPWGKQINATLRPIVKPIAMYARRISTPPEKVPDLSKACGFDLIKSDWVAPFGRGEAADLNFMLVSSDAKVPSGYYEKYPRAIKRKNWTLTVTFLNPDDGIQSFYAHPRRGSAFRSPRYAPDSGYTNELISIYRVDEDNMCNDMAREDQNYIFRIRTKRDESGAITNALYGKIYGSFAYDSEFVSYTYYLNPTPLDRNLEFDWTKNLLKGVVDDNQLPWEP